MGCSWGLIKVNAATESVALIVALNLIINAVDNTTVYVFPITDIKSNELIKYVSPNIAKNDTNVPNKPNIKMYLMFLKNYFFFKL